VGLENSTATDPRDVQWATPLPQDADGSDLRVVNQPLLEESMTARKTKILLDGGDAQETQRIMKQLGFLDGQTTNS
jgi:endonuclease YncB( thermonuclease family)